MRSYTPLYLFFLQYSYQFQFASFCQCALVQIFNGALQILYQLEIIEQRVLCQVDLISLFNGA